MFSKIQGKYRFMGYYKIEEDKPYQTVIKLKEVKIGEDTHAYYVAKNLNTKEVHFLKYITNHGVE